MRITDILRNRMVFAADGLLGGGEGAASSEAPPPSAGDAAAITPPGDVPPVDPPVDPTPPAEKSAEKKLTATSALDDDLEDLPEDKPAEAEVKPADGEDKPEPVFKPEELKMPEGVTLDQTAMDRFAPILNELGLPADKAQPLVDAYIEVRKAEMQAFEDSQVQLKKLSMDDPDIGKGQWKDTITKARKAIDAYGSADFKELLGMSGIANHPATLRFLRQVGATAMDDTPVPSEVAAGQKRDAVDVLYPNQKG